MIVTFAHHKGGTGKTTSCVNVAGFAAAAGAKVLVVDLDPQANATAGLGVDVTTIKASMLDVLTGGVAIRDVILDVGEGVHLAPATLDLVAAEPWLYAQTEDRMLRLSKALQPVLALYDHVLVDTPPGAGVLMLNGIVAADRIVVALDPGVFALEDLHAFDTLLADVETNLGLTRVADVAVVTRALRSGLMDTLLGRPDPVRDVVEELRRRFRTVHVVPYDRAVFESQRRGVPLAAVAPSSPAGAAYRALARDVFDEPPHDNRSYARR